SQTSLRSQRSKKRGYSAFSRAMAGYKPKGGFKRKRADTVSEVVKRARQAINQPVLYSALATPFPAILVTNMTYRFRQCVVVASGTETRFNIRINSLQDPDEAGNLGSTQQPLGHDQLIGSGLYNAYKVKNCILQVQLTLLTDTASSQYSTDYTSVSAAAGGAAYTRTGILDGFFPPMEEADATQTWVDTKGEINIFPGTKRLSLTRAGESKTIKQQINVQKLQAAKGLDHQDVGYASNPGTSLYHNWIVVDEVAPFFASAANITFCQEVEIIYTVELRKLNLVVS
uniref:hypothetical protein n=1 Tax=Polynucleobacter sp. TaxID=2029855 RepID=UPI0040471FCC